MERPFKTTENWDHLPIPEQRRLWRKERPLREANARYLQQRRAVLDRLATQDQPCSTKGRL
jgi:hypothetical protein